MILGKSYWELLLVRTLIYYFSHIGLFCLLYFVIVLEVGGTRAALNGFSIFIEVIGIIEILWYLIWFLPYRAHLQKKPGYTPPPLMKGQRQALFQAMMEYIPDLEQFIRKWAKNAHMEDIRRENLKEWLLWALFEQEGPPGEANVELEDYVAELEERLEIRIKPGRGDAEMLRPSVDPVKISHRSLTYYMFIGIIDLITTATLLTMGFSFYRQPRSSFLRTFPLRPMTLLSPDESASPAMSYFYRPHKSKTQRPIFLIHGIGTGLFPYLRYLRSLPPDIGIIAIELLPLSNRLTKPFPTTPELVDAIAAILAQQSPHFDDEFIFLADSFGTCLAAPMLTQADLAPRIARVVLIDPVAMLLHLPDAAYNLFCRRPRTAAEWTVWWFAGSDPGVAHALARRFSWREVILWRETLQDETVARRSTVVVGGEDAVVNALAVASYGYYGDTNFAAGDVEEWRTTTERWSGAGDVELLWLEGLDHGQVFLTRKAWPLVNRVVETYCQRYQKEGLGFMAMGYNEADPGREVVTVQVLPKEMV